VSRDLPLLVGGVRRVGRGLWRATIVQRQDEGFVVVGQADAPTAREASDRAWRQARAAVGES
jgi:hypothetical protein